MEPGRQFKSVGPGVQMPFAGMPFPTRDQIAKRHFERNMLVNHEPPPGYFTSLPMPYIQQSFPGMRRSPEHYISAFAKKHGFNWKFNTYRDSEDHDDDVNNGEPFQFTTHHLVFEHDPMREDLPEDRYFSLSWKGADHPTRPGEIDFIESSGGLASKVHDMVRHIASENHPRDFALPRHSPSRLKKGADWAAKEQERHGETPW